MFELRLTEVIPVTQSYLKTVATANVACLLIYIKMQSKLGVVMHAFNRSTPKGNFCECWKEVEADESL